MAYPSLRAVLLAVAVVDLRLLLAEPVDERRRSQPAGRSVSTTFAPSADEPLDRGQPHARRAAGDDGDLPLQPRHAVLPFTVGLIL